jgi:hypothetical protein
MGRQRTISLRVACIIGQALMAVVLCSTAWPDATATRREDELKAAYLFNFVKFVEWPSAAGAVITLCFVGGDGIRDALAAGTAGKKVANRPVQVRRLVQAQSAEGCSLLYLDAATLSENGSMLPRAAAMYVLTVSDIGEFTRNGGMIGLFTESNRLRFNVNVDNIRRARLRISSSLLELAASVEKAGPP